VGSGEIVEPLPLGELGVEKLCVVDNLAGYRSHRITFTNGSGIAAVPIAEYAVMAMLAAVKGFPSIIKAQERSEWLPNGPGDRELLGSAALVLGYGAIGRAIAHRLRPFGVEITGVRRRPDGEANVIGLDDWRPILPQFDWVILSTILTDQTRRMIGALELSSMKGRRMAC
jgi:phosphoglycerate dehydrogenase-like enzyme